MNLVLEFTLDSAGWFLCMSYLGPSAWLQLVGGLVEGWLAGDGRIRKWGNCGNGLISRPLSPLGSLSVKEASLDFHIWQEWSPQRVQVEPARSLVAWA